MFVPRARRCHGQKWIVPLPKKRVVEQQVPWQYGGRCQIASGTLEKSVRSPWKSVWNLKKVYGDQKSVRALNCQTGSTACPPVSRTELDCSAYEKSRGGTASSVAEQGRTWDAPKSPPKSQKKCMKSKKSVWNPKKCIFAKMSI